MKKVLLTTLILSVLICLFAISISAAPTDEFGTVEKLTGISEKSAFGDDGKADSYTSRVVLFDGEEYHTYPSYYIFSNSKTPSLSFEEIILASGVEYNKNSVVRVEVPKGLVYVHLPDGYLTIGQDGFNGCSSLVEINIPASCTQTGAYSMNGCSKLTTVTFEGTNFKTLGDRTFEYCSSLESIILPEGLETINSRAFYNCNKLSSIYMPSTVTTIKTQAFQSCKFTEIVIPVGVTTLPSKVFDYCSLNTITLPKTLTSVNSGAFLGCGIKSITYTGVESDAIVTEIKAAAKNATITYANHCDIYYGSNHQCGESKYIFDSFTESAIDQSECQNCGLKSTLATYTPIITLIGFSAKINGDKVCMSYVVDRDMVKIYEEKTNKALGTVKFGVTAAFVEEDMTQYETMNDDLTPANDKTVVVPVKNEYSGFDFILSGFTSEYYNTPLVMCAFVYNGDEIYYIDSACNTYATPFTFNTAAK